MRAGGLIVAIVCASVIGGEGVVRAATPVRFSGARGGIAVLDIRSGLELWTVLPSDRLSYFYARPGKDVIVAKAGTCAADEEGMHESRLVAFDARTGRQRWITPSDAVTVDWITPAARAYQATVPVDAQGVVVTWGAAARRECRDSAREPGSAFGHAPMSTASVRRSRWSSRRTGTNGQSELCSAIDRRNGNERWQRSGWQGAFQVVAADERTVVVANGDLNRQPTGTVTFIVLDARTGKQGRSSTLAILHRSRSARLH